MTSATLTINLAALTDNFTLLSSKLATSRCGAAVKADAYGLGIAEIAPALAKAGCRDFFVATLEEGVQLREVLERWRNKELKKKELSPVPRFPNSPPIIYIIHGAKKGEEKDFLAHGLIPVLSTPEQVARWAKASNEKQGTRNNKKLSRLAPRASILHIDTGMNRLGLSTAQLETLDANLIKKARINTVMSHLACADTPEHELNRIQLEQFRVATSISTLAGMTKSLANSSGIFLGKDYHFDLARPGCALYGINPTLHKKNPLRAVAELTAPILQIRDIAARESVGYGATYVAKKGDRIATVEMGYADGFIRHLGNTAHGFIGDVRVPVIGRVSMDMVTMDVSRVPHAALDKNSRVEFIGTHQSVDEFAQIAGTIGYEIFTRLGARVKRIYR